MKIQFKIDKMCQATKKLKKYQFYGEKKGKKAKLVYIQRVMKTIFSY